MSEKKNMPEITNATSNNACIVCYKNADYYSIGMCEHPVCYECSTRMRVLCQQNECPICRQDLPKVVFTKEVKPFRFLRKGNLVDSRYNIYFESLEIQKQFIKLLAHRCFVCEDNQMFSSFNSLKEHMRRKHDLHYCELCVDNLKIFSHERRCYTKSELSRHCRKGDVDDKSHKGHPLCEFCDKRYMDNDELYRHLRRDHLYCHFCDADGLHQYYSSYDYLTDHFRQEHYLCEEGGCADEQFTSVFRTDIDLKAHKFSVHGKQLGKAAAKQARTLELEFTLAPRGDMRNRRGPPGAPRNHHDGNANHPRNHHSFQEPEPEVIEEPIFVRQPLVDVQSTQEFPTLGNATPCLMPSLPPSKRGNLTIRGTLRQGNYNENFPALGPESSGNTASGAGASSSAVAASSSGNSSGGIPKTLNFSVSTAKKVDSTAGRQQSSAPNLSIHFNHRPNGTVTARLSGPNLRISTPGTSRDLDFPALGRNEAPTTNLTTTTNQWTKVTCVKPSQMQRAKKVAAPPLAPSPPPIQSGEAFPSLTKAKKSSNVSVQPAMSNWVQVTSTDTSSSTSTTDPTKGKAKKKKLKQQNNSNSNGNESTSSVNKKLSSEANARSNKENSETCNKKEQTSKSKKNNKNQTSESKAAAISNNIETSKTSISASEAAAAVSASAATPKQRKRSELKIDSLNTSNNNNLSTKTLSSQSSMDSSTKITSSTTSNNGTNSSTHHQSQTTLTNHHEDFPALGGSRVASGPPGLTNPPPGLTNPPPGFGPPPPPGFLSRPNGLTFTNSSGESYAIVPEELQKNKRNFSYSPPVNFQKRNQNLIAEFNHCFGSQESEELKAFRYISGLFRSGLCDADEYYKQCRTVMGSDAFKRVFPELLALLPDIDKQRELYKVHKRETNNHVKGLEACDNCGQILRNSDLQSHATSHTLENHFPALGNGSSNTLAAVGNNAGAGAWAKK